MAKKKQSKYAGRYFPVVPIRFETENESSENSKKTANRTGNVTINDLARMMIPDPNKGAHKKVVEMLTWVNSKLPKQLDGMIEAVHDDASTGGLVKAKNDLQILLAIVEANNEEMNSAILFAMRACKLVTDEGYRPYEEFISKGLVQTKVGKNMALQNRKKKFEISKSQLLKELRKASGANHKERCTSVGKNHDRGQSTIVTKCRDLKIKSADYKNKS